MAYDADRVTELVEAALAREADDPDPGFYAVVGSHAYGFATADSDVDVVGYHVADGRRYMLLDVPVERVAVNRDGATEGFEAWADVELRSFELRTLARRLHRGEVHVVEAVLCGEEVLDTFPEYTDALGDVVASALPMDLPGTYRGMAEHFLDAGRASDDPKPYLHALRTALAARHVAEQEELAVDLRTLSRSVLGDDDLAADLIAARREGAVPADLRECTDAAVTDLLAEPEPDHSFDRGYLRQRLDGWLLDLRREVTPPL